MTLPTLLDISPTNLMVLDERTAYEHFYGRTISEAVALFREKEEVSVDDLAWMGETGFNYYLDAYIVHLESASKVQTDICLAMHLVVMRTQMNRITRKLTRLIETIKIYGKPADPCDPQLVDEYAASVEANLDSK